MTSTEWIVNGTSLSNLNISSVNAVDFDSSVAVGTLNFYDLPLAFNETTVQCRAVGPSFTGLTETRTLYVQGACACSNE